MKVSVDWILKKTNEGRRGVHLLHRRPRQPPPHEVHARLLLASWRSASRTWGHTSCASRTWRASCGRGRRKMLITMLKSTVSIPMHLHTHDTSGNGSCIADRGRQLRRRHRRRRAGADGGHDESAQHERPGRRAARQPERETGMGNKALQPLADYWEVVRDYYTPFECGLKSGTSEVYYHEIPGGQYSNLRPQVASMGLLDRWNDVKHAFAVVNAAGRRHPEGDAEQQDGRRLRGVPGAERPAGDARRFRRDGERDAAEGDRRILAAGLPGQRRHLLPGPPRTSTWRLPRSTAGGGAQRATRRRGTGRRQHASRGLRRAEGPAREAPRAHGHRGRGRQRRAVPASAGRPPRLPQPPRGRVGPRHPHLLLRTGARPGDQRRPSSPARPW